MDLLAITAIAFLVQTPTKIESTPRLQTAHYFAESQPKIDGDLTEWASVKPVPIDQESQLNRFPGNPLSRAWAGPTDCSAEIYFGYSESGFYVAGRIQDDVHVDPTEPWWGADAIELFLCTHPVDPEPAAFDDDDYQIFIMPFRSGQHWGVWSHRGVMGPAQTGFVGVEVAGKRDAAGGGYQFEAVFPWINFPEFADRSPWIRANIAIDDSDQAGAPIKNYLVLTGDSQVYLDSNKMARLEFPRWTSTEARSAVQEISSEIFREIVFAAICLAAIGILFAVVRWLLRATKKRERILHWIVGLVGLWLASIVITWALQWALSRRAQRDMSAAVQELQSVMDSVSQGGIGSLSGTQPADALMSLLDGKPISPKPQMEFAFLSVGTNPAARKTEDGWIPFVDESIPVTQGVPLAFDLLPSQNAEKIALAIQSDGAASPEFNRMDRAAHGQAVFCSLRDAQTGSSEGKIRRLEWNLREARRTYWQNSWAPILLLQADLPSLSDIDRIEILFSELPPGKTRLAGVSLFHEGGWQAARIRTRALNGVPSQFGANPPDWAGQILQPGQDPYRIASPAAFEKLWLFYAVETDAISHGTGFGEPCLEIVPHSRGQVLAPVVLRRDIDVHDFNLDRSPHRSDMESQVAFRWERQGVREHSDVREIRFPGDVQIDELRIHNVSAAPIRLLGVTAGRSLPAQLGNLGKTLEATNEGIRLRSESREILKPYQFAFYLPNGSWVKASGEGKAQGPLSVPNLDRVVGKGEPTEFSREREDGALWLGQLVPVRDADHVVGAVEIAQEQKSLVYWSRVVGLLPVFVLILLLPFAVFGFSEWASSFSKIRSKLVAAFLFTSLIPLVLLFVFLSDLALRRYRSAEADSLRSTSALVQERIRKRPEEVSQATAAFARAFLDHPRVRELVQNPEQPQYEAKIQKELFGLRQLLGKSGEWSFVRFEDHRFRDGKYEKRVIFDGPHGEECADLDVPSPSLYEFHGRILAAGVQRIQEENRRFVFVIGEQVSALDSQGLLARVYSKSGYPILGNDLDDRERGPERCAEIRKILEGCVTESQPSERALRFGNQDWNCLSSNLLGADAQPIGYLLLGRKPGDYLLNLGITAVPLRRGLILFGIVIVLSAFVVVRSLTSKITKPIERLEQGAKAIQAGESSASIEAETRDEVGELTTAFNAMSDGLRKRFQQLNQLNLGLTRMSSHLLREQVIEEVVALLKETPKVKSVEFLESEGTEEFGLLSSDSNEFVYSCPVRLRNRFAGVLRVSTDSLLDLAEQEFLKALSGQIAIALENARLYELAIEDESTGAYNGQYFRARLAEEIEKARSENQPLSLMRISIRELDLALQRSGQELHKPLLAQAGECIRRASPPNAVLGRAGLGDFHVLLNRSDKREALKVAETIRQALVNSLGFRPKLTVASFPQDGPSADLLLHILDPRKAGGARTASRVYDVQEKTNSLRVELGDREVAFKSPTLLAILSTVERIAPSDLSVLIEGETGVGKEVIADLIHQQSGRADRPCIKINCAALPENLLEAELFGYEKGAFTGAQARKPGCFELAHGGTLFLDEVGELSPAVQAKFLRVLQDKQILRLGGTTPIQVDVRILAATHLDLLAAMAQGRFRTDLFYRLNGVAIAIPPLRERREEIPEIVSLALEKWNRSEKKQVRGVDAAAMDLLCRHDWPGNIRELLHVVQRACLFCETDEIHLKDLQIEAIPMSSPALQPSPTPPIVANATEALNERQVRLVRQLVDKEVITTLEYVSLASVSRRTALRDLAELVDRGVLIRKGKRRAAEYRLNKSK